MDARGESEAQEAKCLRCGRCCRDKYIVESRVYFAEGACRYFDPKTSLCTIYGDRHRINSACLTVEQGIRLGVFPKDCPYVAGLPDYVATAEDVIDKQALRLIGRGKIVTPEELDEHLRKKRDKALRGPKSTKRRKHKR